MRDDLHFASFAGTVESVGTAGRCLRSSKRGEILEKVVAIKSKGFGGSWDGGVLAEDRPAGGFFARESREG